MDDNGYARPELLAEPDWLESVQDDESVCVVDCSASHGQRWAYIPGAVALPVHFSLKDPDDPVHVMRGEQFTEVMQATGVSPDTTVVAYDRHGGMAAARLWWVLTYYGHTGVRLLNGGWHRWRAEGRPITLKPAEPARGTFSAKPNEAVLARLEYVREHLEDAAVQILDVRNRAEWAGQNPWGNHRDGHMPGAHHWEWVNSLSEDPSRVFRPAQELRAALDQAGLDPQREVIAHCQAGIRASHGAFVLNLLGFAHVRNYEAGMREWSSREDAPLVAD